MTGSYGIIYPTKFKRDGVIGMKNKIAAISIMFFSSLVMAEGINDPVYGEMIRKNEMKWREYALSIGKNPPVTEHYQYGMKLDVEKVLHHTSRNIGCGVMPAQMAYKDSSGELRILEYRTSGTLCPGNN